jgi:hypothetical protein
MVDASLGGRSFKTVMATPCSASSISTRSPAVIITGLPSVNDVTVAGSSIYVSVSHDMSPGPAVIDEYTLTGGVGNAALITGLCDPSQVALADYTGGATTGGTPACGTGGTPGGGPGNTAANPPFTDLCRTLKSGRSPFKWSNSILTFMSACLALDRV